MPLYTFDFPQLLPAYLSTEDPSQVYRSLNVTFCPLPRLCARDLDWENWVEREYQLCPLVAWLLCLTLQRQNTHVGNNSFWAFCVWNTSPKWSVSSLKQSSWCVSKNCQFECGKKMSRRSSVWGKEAIHFSSGSPGQLILPPSLVFFPFCASTVSRPSVSSIGIRARWLLAYDALTLEL